MTRFALALLLLSTSVVTAAETTLIPAGSVWSYLDDGSNAGTAWRAPGFDASAWASGAAELGYGDGDESTVVSFGPDSANKHTTTYFRRAFSVADPAAIAALDLGLRRDDGAVVYLNGAEVFRSNMPGGTVTSGTFASSAIGGADESTFQTTAVNPALLVPGTNLVAVEIHQANSTSSDISFDLTLVASDGALSVVRGPYLQLSTPTSQVIRWRTSEPSDARVRYGSSPASLDQTADEAAIGSDHEVILTGLSPDTRYYYAVGTTGADLAGGDAEHHFTTAPTPGAARPLSMWVLGDSGTANANAAAVRDAYEAFQGTRHTDLWFMLGDNAYNDGTDAQYQAAVFDMYPKWLRTSTLWPALGNHDGISADSASQTGPYYEIFTLPKNAEAGGLPSGTEAYYSFDYANVHFVCLDSHESDRSPGGAMLTWLDDDLAQTNAEWIIAFWHHPPYTKGSHDSDTESSLVQMRQNALPILEAHGVDLVLSGHSHSYERSLLIDGHYGSSGTFSSSHVVDGGDGRVDGTGAYTKEPVPHDGAVYVVAGSSGKISGGALNHPVMHVSLNELGSVVLDLDGDTLDVNFLNDAGATTDYFTLVKTTGTPPVCNANGLCEAGESCDNCAADCIGSSGATCGNGVCEAGNGEDCVSCAADCAGKQSGKPANRYCCGDGGGENPRPCSDAVCTAGGLQCTDGPASGYCCGDGACEGAENSGVCAVDCPAPTCGDGTCDAGESACSCAADCGTPPTGEGGLCTNGTDDDCDAATDCSDPDCAADAACNPTCQPLGAGCGSDSECCTGKCRGKGGSRTCR